MRISVFVKPEVAIIYRPKVLWHLKILAFLIFRGDLSRILEECYFFVLYLNAVNSSLSKIYRVFNLSSIIFVEIPSRYISNHQTRYIEMPIIVFDVQHYNCSAKNGRDISFYRTCIWDQISKFKFLQLLQWTRVWYERSHGRKCDKLLAARLSFESKSHNKNVT